MLVRLRRNRRSELSTLTSNQPAPPSESPAIASAWDTLHGHLDAAEAFLTELDEMDLEPFLGSIGAHGSFGFYADERHGASAVTDDRKVVCEDKGAATGDNEPWLGRAETG